MAEKEMVEPEKVEEIIDKVARKIVESGMEGPAIFFLQSMKPISFIAGELATFTLSPYLILLEEKGFDFIDIFEKRENLEKLIKRVEELAKEKSEKEKKPRGSGFLKGIKAKLFPDKAKPRNI